MIKVEDIDLITFALYRNANGTFTKKGMVHFHKPICSDLLRESTRGKKFIGKPEEFDSVQEEFSPEKLNDFFDYFETEFSEDV